MNSSQLGTALLMKQYKELSRNPPDGIFVGLIDDSDLYKWRVILQGPSATIWEGGYFPTTLIFPKDFPNKPPVMHFTMKDFWHPNVYPDGKVCISILHEYKEDQMNTQEKLSEKWRPILSVEAVLVSVLSMLDAPNINSPANIDASVQYKDHYKEYKRRIRRLVRQSQEAL